VVTLLLWLGFAAFFWLFAWRGITDAIMSVYQYVAFAVAAAVVYLTPYFADRALSPRLPRRRERLLALQARQRRRIGSDRIPGPDNR
jgi:hypothetical protein